MQGWWPGLWGSHEPPSRMQTGLQNSVSPQSPLPGLCKGAGGGEVGLPLAQNASGEGLRASCLQFPGSSRVVVPSPPHRASPSIYNCTSDNLFIIIYLFICLWMYLCEGPGVLEDPVLGAVPDSRVFCENRAGLSAPPTRPPRLTAFLLLMFKTNYLCNPVVLMLIW